MSGPGAMPFVSLNRQGFAAFTTTRQGGGSQGAYLSLNLGLHVGDDPERVRANRQALWEARGLKGLAPVVLEQVHGERLVRLDRGAAYAGWNRLEDAVPAADGALALGAGLALVVGHADCQAIVCVDLARRAFGVAHAGWRGALAGMAGLLVSRMAGEFGSAPGDLALGLSPNLHPCCLRLGPAEREAFEKAWGGVEGYGRSEEDGGFRLSLNRLALTQLAAAGVEAGQVEVQSFCTGCNPALFFSHRRDRGTTGRMWTVAGFLE